MTPRPTITSQSNRRRMAARCCLIVGARYPPCIFFDVGGHRDRRNLCELEPARVAPSEESRHSRAVRRARMRVADLGREKLNRPLRGLPLSFLKDPFQRFHAERLKTGVLVEGELSQLPV